MLSIPWVENPLNIPKEAYNLKTKFMKSRHRIPITTCSNIGHGLLLQ